MIDSGPDALETRDSSATFEFSGSGGNDFLCANKGDDDLFGEGGKDDLKGGKGSDKCRGGPGKDTTSACEA